MYLYILFFVNSTDLVDRWSSGSTFSICGCLPSLRYSWHTGRAVTKHILTRVSRVSFRWASTKEKSTIQAGIEPLTLDTEELRWSALRLPRSSRSLLISVYLGLWLSNFFIQSVFLVFGLPCRFSPTIEVFVVV